MVNAICALVLIYIKNDLDPITKHNQTDFVIGKIELAVLKLSFTLEILDLVQLFREIAELCIFGMFYSYFVNNKSLL